MAADFENPVYLGSVEHCAEHETVKHAAGDMYTATSAPTPSNARSASRGMKGVDQHCAEKHLHRYLAEFEFRNNNRTALGVNDKKRAATTLTGIAGKRLTYRRTNEAPV